MSTRRRGLRDRLHLGHHRHDSEDPYNPQNWPTGADPLGGVRPFPIPPTPTDSSASLSAGEEGHRRRRHHSGSRSRHKSGDKSKKKSSRHRDRGGVGVDGERPVIDEEGDREESERRRRRRSISVGARDGSNFANGPGSVGSSDSPSSSSEGLSAEGGGVALRGGGRDSSVASARPSRPPPNTTNSAPIVVNTPTTSQQGNIGDIDLAAREIRKQKRRSTQPVPASTAVPRSILINHDHGHGHSRSGSYPERGYEFAHANMPPAPDDYYNDIDHHAYEHHPDIVPPALVYPTRHRPSVSIVEQPPYPATPPPLGPEGEGEEGSYVTSPQQESYQPQRLPTILRVGGKKSSHHDPPPPVPQLPPPPGVQQAPVEIGEGRELQRTDSGRRLFRSRSKTTPAPSPLSHDSRSNSISSQHDQHAPPPRSPTSPAPTSYRNSIYSTISSLTRSLSKSSPSSKRPTHTSSQHLENGFSILSTFDTVFLIDDSPSMLYQSRWNDTFDALISISEIATKYDTDGIDIHFLNSPEHDTLRIKNPDQVREVFSRVRPVSGGSTPLGQRLDELLRAYIERYRRAKAEALSGLSSPTGTDSSSNGNSNSSTTSSSPVINPPRLTTLIKPLNILVLTDGDATDDPESVIVWAARELERLNAPLTQVGIQMFQVGGDPEAAEFLRGLDDDLGEVYGIRDMVDTTPYYGREGGGGGGEGGEGCLSGEEMLKVLVGAVNRRIDRRENVRAGGGGVGGYGGGVYGGA